MEKRKKKIKWEKLAKLPDYKNISTIQGIAKKTNNISDVALFF